MAKPTIVTRASKGSALTWTEGDANFTNLRDATLTVTDGTNSKALNLNDTLTFTAGTNVTLSVNATTGAVTINSSSSSSGTVTSVSGTGTVNGLTLTGTVTSSGSLTLGGTLDLSSPPTIGGTTPGAATFSSLATTTNAYSGTAWTTSPPNLKIQGRSFTDTSSSGTVAEVRINAVGAPTLIASNSTTYTDASALYVSSPIASTNVTITNAWSILASGKIKASQFSGSGAGLTSIPNSALTNSSITINGSAISLGGSVSTGTVTSVAALTLGTTGTDVSSSVATGTSTPVITLNLPSASATNRGLLTSADWTTFNNKGSGTVTSVAALTLGTTGTDVSSSVATGTSTPVITLNLPTASSTARGLLSSTDWTTFNNKGSGTVTSVAGTGTVNGLSLSGTVTSTGNLTLGGTLDLSSPPAIGGTAPSTGAFTTVSASTTTTSGALNVTYNPSATSGAAIQATGKDSQGGTGYFDFLKTTNTTTGVTNASKTFRTSSTGELQIINSGYSATILALTDAGLLTLQSLSVSKDIRETTYTGGSTTGTITPDCANGTVQKITLSGSITWNAFSNPVSGQSMTMIITQPSSGGPYTLTSSMKFAGGTKTLSTAANAVDIISVFYDGSNYWASLSTGFA
jgi:hypothetical protein